MAALNRATVAAARGAWAGFARSTSACEASFDCLDHALSRHAILDAGSAELVGHVCLVGWRRWGEYDSIRPRR